jgi:leucyl-tRNA synthetase
MLGKPYSIHIQSWPKVDEVAALQDEITLVIQVDGKVRDRLTVPTDISEADAKQAALGCEAVQKALDGKPPRQVIYVKGRLVNIVS